MQVDANTVRLSRGKTREPNRIADRSGVGLTRSDTKHPGPRGTPKARLLSQRQIDRRTRAWREFAKIVHAATIDLDPVGRGDTLPIATKLLIEALAAAGIRLRDYNIRMLRGESTDVLLHGQALSTIVRIVARLPASRVLQDVTPNLHDLMNEVVVDDGDDERSEEVSP